MELAFQDVLLKSIDDSVENREEAINEIKAEIELLKKRLRGLSHRTTSTASSSRQSASQSSIRATHSPPSKSPNKQAQGQDRNYLGMLSLFRP